MAIQDKPLEHIYRHFSLFSIIPSHQIEHLIPLIWHPYSLNGLFISYLFNGFFLIDSSLIITFLLSVGPYCPYSSLFVQPF